VHTLSSIRYDTGKQCITSTIQKVSKAEVARNVTVCGGQPHSKALMCYNNEIKKEIMTNIASLTH